jgi:hypothetical protein
MPEQLLSAMAFMMQAAGRRGQREPFDAFLAKVPDAPPMPGDAL